MKKFYLIAAFTFFSIISFAAPVDTAKVSGNWTSSSTWSLNRMPADGDTVVIPSNRTVTLSSSQSLNNVYLEVFGNLEITGLFTALKLDLASTIAVYKNGSITAPFLVGL